MWLALREHGVTYEQAAADYAFREQGADMESEEAKRQAWEQFRLFDALYGRRRTFQPDETGSSDDVSRTWCGKGMAELAAEYGIEQVGKLSLDQFEWLSSQGTADEAARWGDLQKIQDDLPARVAAIQAAMASGTMEIPNGQ